MYTYSADKTGRRFLHALVAACQRGVNIRVMVDSVGSITLPDSFWNPLREAGGEVRWFNPFKSKRWSHRNHRKILVSDELTAVIGGVNISPEYEGDGVEHGWRDLGVRVAGPLARELAESFDAYFEQAPFRRRHRRQLKRSQKRKLSGAGWRLLLTDSPRHRAELRRALAKDLRRASRVDVSCAYFLPTWQLRKLLMAVARRGGKVRLILPSKSDVLLSQLAARRLYSALLRAGVQVYEYQPQILHAKLYIVDDAVYVGSANLDIRSLRINHELLVRFSHPGVAAEARALFEADLPRCQPIDRRTWSRSRSAWSRFREAMAYFFLVRVDPYLARWQLRI
jgi:cardiolipin synthase